MNENLIGQQIPTAIISAYVIQWLKSQPWFPFAKMNVAWLNRLTSALTALATAGAIHYTFGSNGDFSLNGNIYTLMHVVWATVQQFALQHVVYKVAIAPPASPVLVAADPPHAIVTKEEPKSEEPPKAVVPVTMQAPVVPITKIPPARGPL